MDPVAGMVKDLCPDLECICCQASLRVYMGLQMDKFRGVVTNVWSRYYVYVNRVTDTMARIKNHLKSAEYMTGELSQVQFDSPMLDYLQARFPDLTSFFVEQAPETHFVWTSEIERYLVQVGSIGFYMKMSTLRRCTFFEAMFSNVYRESEGRCHLQMDERIFHEEAFCAVMEFLGGDRVNYAKYGWVDVLLASDYLGCEEMKTGIDSHILRLGESVDLAHSVYLLRNIETHPGWNLPLSAFFCLEMIKAHLRYLVLEESPYELIGKLSHAALLGILTDSRLTYFTSREKGHLVWKWIYSAETVTEQWRRAGMLQFVTQSDDSCSTELCHETMPEGLRHQHFIQFCPKHTKPIIILAGGTGDGVRHSRRGHLSRPITPSKTLVAYSIEDDSWTYLPDLPINMLKPLLATNGLDEIYITDSHGFRAEDLINIHYIFSLKLDIFGWHWKSYSFEIPCGILGFELAHVFCVQHKIYLLGTGKVFDRMVLDWGEGPEYRKHLLEHLRGSEPGEHVERVKALLLTFNPRDSTVNLIRFLFNMERKCQERLNACVIDENICMETSSGYLINGDPNRSSQIFATFSCADGRFRCKVGSVIRAEYDLLVPDCQSSGLLAVTMGGSCYRSFRVNAQSWMEMGSRTVPFPYYGPMGGEGVIRRSYTMVAHGKKLFFIGGWCVNKKRSQNTCMVFTLPERNEITNWNLIATAPVNIMHAGSTYSHFVNQAVSHNMNCPHCALYPNEVREADQSQVDIPQYYEAYLYRAYPPKGEF